MAPTTPAGKLAAGAARRSVDTPPTTPFSVRLPPATRARLIAAAEAAGVTVSELVTRAITQALEDQ